MEERIPSCPQQRQRFRQVWHGVGGIAVKRGQDAEHAECGSLGAHVPAPPGKLDRAAACRAA